MLAARCGSWSLRGRHAIEAAKRLKALLYTAGGNGRRVRLTARDAGSSNLGRESRFVATKGPDGTWHDVGTVLVREGQVIPSYQKTEYSRNASYPELSEAAAAAGIGIWDTSYCGPGPARLHLSGRRPGETRSVVFIHVGKAPSSPTAGHFYYGLSAPIFENVTPAPVSLGDGGYLFDPARRPAWLAAVPVRLRGHQRLHRLKWLAH